MASDPLQQHRKAMGDALNQGGAGAVVEYIQGFDSEPLRRVLYIASKNVLAPPDSAGKRLDDLIVVADAGVAEMRRQIDAEPDAEARARIVHGAHIVSYNLAAELADCWPGDDFPRTRAHHERGVRAANDCLSWSQPAGAPKPIANDYWVRGIHELALGDVEAASGSWTKALEHAVKAAEADVRSTDVGPDGTFPVNLSAGYLGLARWAAGDEEGRRVYDDAVAAFRAQLGGEQGDDAKLAIGQLEKTREQHGP